MHNEKNVAIFSRAWLKMFDQMDIMLSAQANTLSGTEPDVSAVEHTEAVMRDLKALEKQLLAMSRAGHGIESN